MRCLAALAWALGLALAGAPAAAAENQPTNSTQLARQRFREAKEAYRERRYSAAASLFEAADRLAPHPSTRFNAAAARDEAGEAARAATGYEAVLAMPALEDEKRKVAEERLASLKLELGKILVPRPLGAFVTVDHMQRAPVPTTFYLLPGGYQLQVEYRGETSNNPLEVLAGRDHEVKLDLAEPEPAARSIPSRPVDRVELEHRVGDHRTQACACDLSQPVRHSRTRRDAARRTVNAECAAGGEQWR